jgi:small subunit ribosomal protein S2
MHVEFNLKKNMISVTITDLFNAGVHVGHLPRHWNVGVWKYLYGVSNNTHVIDLVKTKRLLIRACDYVSQAAKEGKTFFFVGTKPSINKIIEKQANRCDRSSFVNGRWIGGTLTNWSVVRTRVEWLREILQEKENGTFGHDLTEKEIASIDRVVAKRVLGLRGLFGMTRLPDIAIIVDPREEAYAVAECRRLGISVVAIADTNCNLETVDVPIIGNDDGGASVDFILSNLVDSILN